MRNDNVTSQAPVMEYFSPQGRPDDVAVLTPAWQPRRPVHI
jgi:hypothetical protein